MEQTRFECVELLSWKAEHAVLAGPFERRRRRGNLWFSGVAEYQDDLAIAIDFNALYFNATTRG
jgi:hypothetical protein